MSITVLIENKEINGAYKKLSNQYKGRKDNYFALLYLMKKFKITLEEASSCVSFGENECGIDAFYHDRTTRNLYLFQFKWSEDHLLFRDQLQRLVDDGIERIFGNSSWYHQSQSQLLIRLTTCITENSSIIDRVLIHFVFNGDPIKAEQSKVLDLLRERLESKKYIIDRYFGRQIDIISQVISNEKTLGHPILRKQSAVYTVELDSLLKVANQNNELVVTFISLDILHKMYSDLGEKFFEKNIRSGLDDGKMTNSEIKKSLEMILANKEPSEYFTFYHNGVALTAQELALDGRSLKMTEPRLLNGAQTVKTLKQFVEEENKKRVDNKNKVQELLDRIKVMMRIVRSREEEFLKRVTINNNRQNPIMPWNLRANDIVQLQLEEQFRDRLGIYYERRENSLTNLTNEDLEDMNITTHTKAIEIRKLAQTLLALHGEVDKISQIKEVFENERWYNDTFRKEYLDIDPRKMVLLYKIQYRMPTIVREIQYIGYGRYDHAGKLRNLVWCLAIQGIMNEDNFDSYVQTYGHSLNIEANLNIVLKNIASTKLRFILRDTFNDSFRYREYLNQSKYSFLKTKATYNECMQAATRKFGWDKKDLLT
jgi:hypothetical protein